MKYLVIATPENTVRCGDIWIGILHPFPYTTSVHAVDSLLEAWKLVTKIQKQYSYVTTKIKEVKK